ncbi:MAG: hypothetical protein AAF962_14100 [Actinomycetota bacterium]
MSEEFIALAVVSSLSMGWCVGVPLLVRLVIVGMERLCRARS